MKYFGEEANAAAMSKEIEKVMVASARPQKEESDFGTLLVWGIVLGLVWGLIAGKTPVAATATPARRI